MAEHLVDWICMDDLPLSILSSPSLQASLLYTNPKAVIPDLDVITEILTGKSNAALAELNRMLPVSVLFPTVRSSRLFTEPRLDDRIEHTPHLRNLGQSVQNCLFPLSLRLVAGRGFQISPDLGSVLCELEDPIRPTVSTDSSLGHSISRDPPPGKRP